MDIKEISTNFGITYIGNYMGCHEGLHALSDVYKVIPMPVSGLKENGDNIITYEPMLLPFSFFCEKSVVYFKECDILLICDVKDNKLKIFNELRKENNNV